MALTTQQQAIQNQINAFDSNTGTQLLLSTLLQAINAGDVRQGYADSAAFPTDSAFIGMIGFDDFDSSLRYVGRDLVAHKIDSADIVSAGGGGGLAPLPAADMRGTVHGYSVSGHPGVADFNKYSYVSDNNVTDIGDFGPLYPSGPGATAVYGAASGDGPVGGYLMSGVYTPPSNSVYNHDIVRYPYANETFVDTGYTMANSGYPGGYNYHTGTVGTRDYVYHSGGFNFTPSPTTNTKPSDWLDIIGKFNAASEANGTDVGDLTQIGGLGSQASSSTHGYRFGGYNQGVNDTIDKWAFASDGNASSPGNMAYRTPGTPSSNNQRYNSSGHSDTKAYIFEGRRSPGQESAVAPFMNEVVTHTFASDASSGIGALDLDTAYGGTATSSSVTVYRAAGYDAAASANITRVAKLDTSTEATMTDVGDLTTATRYAANSSGPTGQGPTI